MEASNNFRKIQLLLQNMLEGKIVINENHTEKLLKFLEDANENSPGKQLIDTPWFSDLIYHKFVNINSAPSVQAKTFIINLITILFKNELQFSKIKMLGFKESFNKFYILHYLSSKPAPNLYLACIKLITAQLNHCYGLQVIVENKLWQYVLEPKIHLKQKIISKAAYNFMAKLVSKLNEYNFETELIEVLRYVLEPILTSDYLNLSILDTETDTMLSDKILTYMNALLAIITEANNSRPNKVVSLLTEYFIVQSKLFDIYNATKCQELLKLINACIFRIWFGMLSHLLFDKKTDEFCIKMAVVHRNYIVNALKKRDAFAIIDYVVQSSIIWSGIEKSYAGELNLPLTFEQNGQKIEFSLQIVINLMAPLLKYVGLYKISKNLTVTNIIEQFMMKMGKSVTDYIFSCCYSFGSLLEEASVTYRKKITSQALKELLRLKGHLNESQTGPIFQSLYYLLELYILSDEKSGMVVNENSMEEDDIRLLTHLLDAMKMLLKEYTISWYENVEIVTVQAVLLILLKQSFLTTKQVIQVIDLIDICVKKFLSPNMSLLVGNNYRKCSTLNEIGEVVKLYTQHDEWEVRDSAFNLLNSCTEISFIKYMPLQKVIKENNLMIIASKAALTDSDFYSQCSALKCLAAATKIDSIWQEVLLDNMHIYLQLVYILRNHTEGIVRTEAANVITGVYLNQKKKPHFQNNLYTIMLTVALDDLHWEVQLAALNFWKKVIHNHFTYRGMLDGKFPSVTFSKEKRKIIVLNEKEIRNQLSNVLYDLSAVGCLTVLVESMNEINNINVMVQANSIAKELISIFEIYKFEKVDKIGTEGLKPQYHINRNIPMDLSHTPTEKERDTIIDNILSLDQTELIISLHDNFSQIKSHEMDIDHVYHTNRKLIQPNDFLETFRQTDYTLLIENKKNFHSDSLGTLDGLLDEILDSDAIV